MNPSQTDPADIRIDPDPEAPRATGRAARIALGIIGFYRRNISPALPMLFGPACGCRFSPTCSEYASDAFSTRGALSGTWLTLRRLARCHPFQRGGYDPVPPAAAPHLRAVRVSRPALD